MIRADIALPAIATVEAALRKTTQVLACEVACPTAHAPDWSELEWRIATAVAALQGISTLLSNGLRWRGPDLWEAFLAEQKRHAVLRQQRILELLARIEREAQRAAIALVALKGSALYRLGIYRVGERPMGDIDLLVKSEDLEAAVRLLETLRYAEELSTWRHHIFTPMRQPTGQDSASISIIRSRSSCTLGSWSACRHSTRTSPRWNFLDRRPRD